MIPKRQQERHGLAIGYLLNVGGAIVPIGLSLITIPIYIKQIGIDRYGILALGWIMVGYFGLFDMGLSRAAANALSRLPSDSTERAPLIATALLLNAVLGMCGALVLYGCGFLAASYSSKFASLSSEIRAALPAIALLLPLTMLGAIGIGALDSREKFAVANGFGILGSVLTLTLPLASVLWLGPELHVVFGATAIGRAASIVPCLCYVFATEGLFERFYFDRKQVAPLVSYGSWVTVTSAVSPILETLDQVLIGTLLGPAAVSHYSIPMNMASKLQIVAYGLSRTLFPRFSKCDRDEASLIAERMYSTLSFWFAAVCAPAALLSAPFLALWISPDFANSAAAVAQLLFVAVWLNGLAYIPYTLLQSQGRPDVVAKLHLLEIGPFIAVLLWSMHVYGLLGAALAWTLRVGADLLLLLYASGMRKKAVLAMAFPTVVMAFALGGAMLFNAASPASMLLASIGASGLLVASAVVLDRETRSALKRRARVGP